MHQMRFVLCSAAALLAVTVACSKSPDAPLAPSSATEPPTAAAADGSNLKVPAPTAVSPVNNAQPDSLVLVSNKVVGKFNPNIAVSYQFEIKTAAGSILNACTATVPGGSGNTVSFVPNCAIEFDAPHTWAVRAVYEGAVGPWSSPATFRSPSGGYINGNEVFDPLTNGKTAGIAVNTSFVPGVGIRLNGHDSRVTYELPQNLQAGEFSLMATGYDEGSPGDKTKIMTMQEGYNDITDNDYRMTVEKRGRSYETPGAVTWRIIMGEADEHAGRIVDGARIGIGFSDERWYFWKFTWNSSRASLEVREDGPRGRVIYATDRSTLGFAYRPVPHIASLGSTIGRGGPIDASIPGAIYKNVWLSSRPRPAFPGE